MIASRTTRIPNAVTVSALLVLVVLALPALLPLFQAMRPRSTRAEAPAAQVFPAYRLNEFGAYRLSEWGVDASPAWTQAPWFDLSRLPAGYVRSEKGGMAAHPRDLYSDLMAVK